MNINQAEDYINRNISSYLSLLKSMVDINSFTLNHKGIDELGKLTASIFERLGFSGRQLDSKDKTCGKHLVLTRKGSTDKTIAFISHLDTVFTEEEEKNNSFYWREEKDRIYGPGTVDIKGGTMMIYIMLDLLKEFQTDLFNSVNLVILLDSAEETGGADFGDLCREELDKESTEACLVFEGSNIQKKDHYQVISRRGMATFTINVEGRSAHSGTSHSKGANAIVQMAHIVKDLALITDYDKNVTVNVGSITGGTVRNRVADKCTVELEMRAADLYHFHEAVKKIENISENTIISSPYDQWACKISIHKEFVTLPWEKNERTDKLYSFWRKAAGELGLNMKEENRGGLSDGNLIWQDYAVLDGLGPGGANSHCSEKDRDNGKEQEYLTKSSIKPVALINTFALIELIRNSLSGSHQ